jgi:hypothetical protein
MPSDHRQTDRRRTAREEAEPTVRFANGVGDIPVVKALVQLTLERTT